LTPSHDIYNGSQAGNTSGVLIETERCGGPDLLLGVRKDRNDPRGSGAVLRTGLPTGTPQEALDTACTVHLTGLSHEPGP
jgi:hypothetical protein